MGDNYYNEALIAYNDEDFSKGIDAATKAIDMGYKGTDIYGLRGLCYKGLDRHEEAIKDFNVCLNTEPMDYWLLTKRGESYFELADDLNAFKDFDKYIKESKVYGGAYLYRGLCQFHLNNYSEALQDFDKAEEFDCVDEDLLLRRAEIKYCSGNYEGARKDILRLTEMDNEDSKGYTLLGKIEFQLENYDVSIQHLSKAIYLNGDARENYYLRMCSYINTQQFAKAKEDGKRALLLKTDFFDFTLEDVKERLDEIVTLKDGSMTYLGPVKKKGRNHK